MIQIFNFATWKIKLEKFAVSFWTLGLDDILTYRYRYMYMNITKKITFFFMTTYLKTWMVQIKENTKKISNFK